MYVCMMVSKRTWCESRWCLVSIVWEPCGVVMSVETLKESRERVYQEAVSITGVLEHWKSPHCTVGGPATTFVIGERERETEIGWWRITE